ncbi:MAG: M20/M25/M40 family metallo-hydrolase [Flavihumibacter sp.]
MKKLFLLLFAAAGMGVQAQMPASFPALLRAEQDSIITWRRWFHQHPELSNREVNTGAKIAALLQSWGLEVQTGLAGHGVKAVLKGGKPGAVIAFRADIDGLPVTEPAGLPFASHETASYNGQTTGVMHACGHDAHIAMLLGTAKILSKLRKDLPGTVVFIFQPAEEGPPPGETGGASQVVAKARWISRK